MAINPFKVAGFESKERLRSSEIKEDCLRFILWGNEELYLNIVRRVNVAINPSKSLVLRAKNGYVARKLKKIAYVLFSGEMKSCI